MVTRSKELALLPLAALFLLPPVEALAQRISREERFRSAPPALLQAEEKYWRRETFAIPPEIVLEVGGLLALPDGRMMVATRHGDLWLVDAAAGAGAPRFKLFAAGLHEPLGLTAAPNGGFLVAQRPEITRVVDRDGDGRADFFEALAVLPISGNYHEYSYGPVVAPNGNLRVSLNLAFGPQSQSIVPWRGWMIEITPQGRIVPIAAGLRSPAGLILGSSGDWFFTENQGEWVGSGRVTHIEPGDFTGHPASLLWSSQPGSTVELNVGDIPNSGEPLHVVAQRVRGLKLPAVWLPHTILGISNTDIIEDRTGGKFGPYAGQFFVGDAGQSKVVRVSLEKVRGVWQGAAYHFRSGFESGVVRLALATDGSMWVGQTSRAWGSVGPRPFALERLVWTGRMPFEVRNVRAMPDGFLLEFTAPADRALAGDPASYALSSFTYKYHLTYGSPPIEVARAVVRKAVVAADGLSVRLGVAGLREAFIHEIKAPGVRATTGRDDALLHDTVYYTLNRRPDGDRILTKEEETPEFCEPTTVASAASAKHQTNPPAAWDGKIDQTIVLGAERGLKFDRTELTARPGAKIRFTLRNNDEMLHNFLLCAVGAGSAVGEAAAAMGVTGPEKSFAPDLPAVLAHTALLQPGASETIYFEAPTTPGRYEFICSFPGHAALMRGILLVNAP